MRGLIGLPGVIMGVSGSNHLPWFSIPKLLHKLHHLFQSIRLQHEELVHFMHIQYSTEVSTSLCNIT